MLVLNPTVPAGVRRTVSTTPVRAALGAKRSQCAPTSRFHGLSTTPSCQDRSAINSAGEP